MFQNVKNRAAKGGVVTDDTQVTFDAGTHLVSDILNILARAYTLDEKWASIADTESKFGGINNPKYCWFRGNRQDP